VPAKQLPITSLFFARLLSKTVMRPNSKNMKSFLESGVFDKSVIRPEFVDHYLTFIDKESHPMLFMNGQTRGLKFNPEMLFINELKDIKQPTFVVLGSNDPLLPSHKIATLVRKIKNVKLKMFKDTGHVTSLEQSTLFNNEVLNFLKK
ncbi:MAG: alpha/beta fold hydrolase, partial [Mucilaginibacter sp.]